MAKGTGVAIRHRDYDAYAKKWKRCRDVVSGQDAIHAGQQLYLDMLAEETADEYLKRIRRTPFYNASWRTIAGFAGMLFRKPPVLEAPNQLEPLLEDVTMSGVSFEAFAKEAAYEDLTVSRLGVFVDHPVQHSNEDGSPVTVAQAEKLGLRPVMHQYKAEAIIDWKYSFINNKNTLVQVRLLEEHSVEKNEFKTEYEKLIKVLDLVEGKYRIRTFKEDNEEQIGEDVYPLMNGKNLDYIPFYFIGPDSTEATLDDPILIDLIDLNIKHYQVSADYEHGCHFTGLPTAVISGYQSGFDETTGKQVPANFYIGSPTAWVFPDPNATAKFLEFTGQGLTALKDNLASKENQMAAIGARMLAPEKSGVEAAHTLAMRHSGEHSILAAISIAVSEGLAKALKVFAEWAGVKGEIKFEINRDFIPVVADSALMTQLLSLVQAGKLDDESLFDWLKRADLIKPELTFEEMQERIDAMPPPVAIGPNGQPIAPVEEDDELDENGKPKKKPPAKPEPKPAPNE